MKNKIFRNIAVTASIIGLLLSAMPVANASVAPVSGFSASFSGGNITLSWTVPNDGTINQLEIHFSTSQITEGNFYISPQLMNVPQPIPGATQSMQISGFSADTTYNFGIRASNIMAEYSPIVITSVNTGNGGGGGGGGGDGCNSPFPVANFLGTANSNSEIALSWATPSQGDLSQIEIHFSTSQITEGNFYISPQLMNVPQPIPGTTQTINVGGLNKDTTYYFAIKLTNICAISSPLVITSAKTLAGGNNGGGGGGGGGGGSNTPITAISNARVIINDGAEQTDTVDVKLSLVAKSAAQMKIANSANLKDANWEAYTDSKSWTLTEGWGMKTVYVKYRNSNQEESEIVSDEIRYGDAPVTPEPETPVTPEPTIIYVPVPQTTVVSGVKESILDFNTLMVNWGENRAGNYADLNYDGKVNSRDVSELMDGWVDIRVDDAYIPSKIASKFSALPDTVTAIEGQEISIIVIATPEKDALNYTARMEMHYPSDIFKYDSTTYWSGWVPVVRDDYDVVDEENGMIIKTAGMPKGFNEKTIFALVKFTAKKSGSGFISFGDSSFVLNDDNFDTLTGTNLFALANMNSITKTPKGIFQLANLLSFGKAGNFASFIAVFVFFGIVYAGYAIFGRKRKLA